MKLHLKSYEGRKLDENEMASLNMILGEKVMNERKKDIAYLVKHGFSRGHISEKEGYVNFAQHLELVAYEDKETKALFKGLDIAHNPLVMHDYLDLPGHSMNQLISCDVGIYHNKHISGAITTDVVNPFKRDGYNCSELILIGPVNATSAEEAIYTLNQRVKDETPETIAAKIYRRKVEIHRETLRVLELTLSGLEAAVDKKQDKRKELDLTSTGPNDSNSM
jgi:hypothetical protein